MSDSELLVAVLARFARLLPTARELPELLDELLRGAVEVLEPDGATVTLCLPQQPEYFGGIPEKLLELEACQWDCALGPAVVAHSCGNAMTVTDIAHYGDMWPEFADLAGQHGLSSVAAVPMRVEHTETGVLSLYSRQPRQWTERDLSVAALLAGMAAGHIVTVDVVRQHQRVAEQLRHALTTRIVVEQAKGVIAHAHHTTPDAAFELIRTHARRNRVTVHAVARGIVELGLRI
ncbi:GAF and ANTAR domain-containing protein [Nocardia uniformis]|uniref:GAF and ANTAR domain-containing protein n=1 Tax=Nocardia uniformis TaxID=53432 RepID=A0A849BSB4_9NOCA|nr:ANTAR domain-containing protein [Nocardia uniformis]NNH69522.1 GAF and ANTAR domain-containing protein [Nocardia uniformis]